MVELFGFLVYLIIFFIPAMMLYSWLNKPKERTGHHDSYPGSYYYDSNKKKWD